MAATVIINRWTGAGPTQTDITSSNTRASTSDDPAPGTANPIPIPAAGTNYSFWVSTRLEVTVTPDGTINNIQWYTDGANGFGTGVTVNGQDASAYVQATGTVGSTGDELTQGNHANLSAAPVDVFTFDSGSPKAITGSMTNPNTGDLGDFFVYQFAVADTAAAGATPQETFTWQFDET